MGVGSLPKCWPIKYQSLVVKSGDHLRPNASTICSKGPTKPYIREQQ